jgi:hypothetical protein
MPAVPSEKFINALASEILTAELEPLGRFMDAVEARQIKARTQDKAEQFRTVAARARHIINRGLDLRDVRQLCMKSASLFAILEVALFERAAQKGNLNLPNWSGYGR